MRLLNLQASLSKSVLGAGAMHASRDKRMCVPRATKVGYGVF